MWSSISPFDNPLDRLGVVSEAELLSTPSPSRGTATISVGADTDAYRVAPVIKHHIAQALVCGLNDATSV